MKPTLQRIPSIVVIQERHVRHGENFKIFKVTSRSRREYIAKFMSPRKVTYRCKSRKVRIGGGLKETTYKGSPLAISRMLLLEGLQVAFPTFEELKKMETNLPGVSQTDSSLSFFNLSDQRPIPGPASSLKLPHIMSGSFGLAPEISQTVDLDITGKNCTPDKISDFNLIFGSDTNEDEDFDSDNEDQEKISVEIAFDSTTPISNPQIGETTENQENNKIIVSLERMEKDIKLIVNAFGAAKNKDSAGQPNDVSVDVASEAQLPKKVSEPKPSISIPPLPLAMRRNQTGPNPLRSIGDMPPPYPSTFIRGEQDPHNIRLQNPHMRLQNPHLNQHVLVPPNGQQVQRSRNASADSNQMSFRYANPSRALSGIIEPSGSIPFFRVPGGCFMVIHATNQTTPCLHATFVTGCSNGLQFQQTQLPVFGTHQIVAIHLGPYRLDREEINGVFAFAKGTEVFTSCNPPRYKR